MIHGTVNQALEPVIRFPIQDASGRSYDIDALIDTGFSGSLTLPSALISALGLPWLSRQQGQLADGTLHAFDVYGASAVWDGQLRAVEVEASANPPLVGTELLRGRDLRIEFVPGGTVTVTARP